jgi:hypothetical protein
MSGCGEVSKQQHYQYILQFDVVASTIAAEFEQHLVDNNYKKKKGKEKEEEKIHFRSHWEVNPSLG